MSDSSSGNSTVQVALRIRPLTGEELITIPTKSQRKVLSTPPFKPNQVIIQGEKKQFFTFDHVFNDNSSQKDVYDHSVRSKVDSFLEGYNVTILTFGQSSSGKTYTMGLSDIFDEEIIDLLNDEKIIKEESNEGISSDNGGNNNKDDHDANNERSKFEKNKIKEIKVDNVGEIMSLLSNGRLNSKMNQKDILIHPSRSHTVFSITLTQQKLIPKSSSSSFSSLSSNISETFKIFKSKSREDLKSLNHKNSFEGDWVSVTSKFQFVDLATNHLVRKSEIIPSSNDIISLNHLIRSISGSTNQENNIHDSDDLYYDKNLSFKLKEHLCENSEILVIACVPPSEYYINETIKVLDCVNQVRNIKYKAVISQEPEEEGDNMIENLEVEFQHLHKIYTEMSQVLLGDISNNESLSKYLALLNANDQKEFIENLWPSFEKTVKPIIQDYEKSICSLEQQLNNARETLTNSESTIQVRELKLHETEKANEKNKILINEIKSKLTKLIEHEETTESYIKNLEIRLNIESSQQIKDLNVIEELRVKLDDFENSEENNEILINQLESKLESTQNSAREILDKSLTLEKSLQEKDNEFNILQERIEKQMNIDTEEKQWLLDEITERDQRILLLERNVYDIDDDSYNNEFLPSVTTLESKLNELQITHDKTIAELKEIKPRYEQCYPKTRSLSVEIQGAEKQELTSSLVIQKLQIELRQLETLHQDKAQGLEKVKQEFARLEINYRETLEIVEELREEIKRRDALAQLEVMSVIASSDYAYTDGGYSPTSSEANQQDIVQRLREEVDMLKEDQLRTIELLEGHEIDYYKSFDHERLKTLIDQLKLELNQKKKNQDQSSSSSSLQIVVESERRKQQEKRSSLSKLKDSGENEVTKQLKDYIEKLQQEIETKKIRSTQKSIVESKYARNKSNLLKENSLLYKAGINKEAEQRRYSEKRDSASTTATLTNDEDEEEQLEIVKLDVQQKYDLIEILKKDLLNKTWLEQKLKQKEIQALLFKNKLIQVHKEEEDLKNEIRKLQMKLQQLENGDDVDQLLKQELESLKAELKQASERESLAQEKLRKLKTNSLISNQDQIQLELQLGNLRNNEIIQRERINVLESKILEKGVQLDEYLLQLKNDLTITKESKINYIQTIENLEIELNKVENLTQFEKLASELQDLKVRETKQLEIIKNLESYLNNQMKISNDFDQFQKLFEEIKDLLYKNNANDDNSWDQEKQVMELKNSESSLKKIIQDLEFKITTTQEEIQLYSSMKEEVDMLKNLEIQQKSQIEELKLQLDIIKASKNAVNKELERLKQEFNQQSNIVESLETDLKFLKIELEKTKESANEKTLELEEVSNLLSDVQKSYEDERKKANTLGIEFEILKLSGNSSSGGVSNDARIMNLTDALTKVKLERMEQDDLLSELEKQLMTVEKDRDAQMQISNELKEVIEEQEANHQEIVLELETKLHNLEEELVKSQDSTIISREIITSLEEKSLRIQSLLEETKNSDKKNSILIKDLEFKLHKANNILKEKENQLSSQDIHIYELEALIQKTQLEIGHAKRSELEASKNVKVLNAKITEVNKLLLQNDPSITDLENARKLASEQSKLVKQLEVRLSLTANHEEGDRIDEIVSGMRLELEEARNSEITKSKLIKELEGTLECKNYNIKELEMAINNSKMELEKVKGLESKHLNLIKKLEFKLQEIELKRNDELTNLHVANKEIDSLKNYCKELQKQIEEPQNNSVNKNVGSQEITGDLNHQLKRANGQIKTYLKQISELQKIIQELKLEKYVKIEENSELIDEVNKLQQDLDLLSKKFSISSSKFESFDELARRQQLRIEELEIKLKKAEKLNQAISIRLSNPEFVKLTATYESLRTINNNLNSKVMDLNAHASKLIEKNKTLQNELTSFINMSDKPTFNEMKEKIKELELVKEELEEINKKFFQECVTLDQKIQTLMEQSWSVNHNENSHIGTHLSELNDQITIKENDLLSLKLKTSKEFIQMENEVARLLNDNENFKQQLKEWSLINSKKLNSNDNLSGQQESTISQQSVMIKSLQKTISDLERKLYEITSGTNVPTPLDMKKILQQHGLPEHFSPGTAESLLEIQKLHKKIIKIEAESLQNKQLVETLENSLNDNETSLETTKQELSAVQTQKNELMNQIKVLNAQLTQAIEEVDKTKMNVKTEKLFMEKNLEEERQAKERSEAARIALERQLERLLAKKHKFMCF
ncbi:10892_t:CDS:10 [Entrophospora sp. SA101]|nr:10892_t:CDS:10 [Entrophospora sp. SA101]